MSDNGVSTSSVLDELDFVDEKRSWVLLVTATACAALGGSIALLNVIANRYPFIAPETLAPAAVCLISCSSIALLRRGMYQAGAHALVAMIFVVLWTLNLRDAYSAMEDYHSHTMYILAGLLPPSLLLGRNWTAVYGALSLIVIGWMTVLIARTGADWSAFAIDHTSTIVFISVFATVIAYVYSLALDTSRELFEKLAASVDERLRAERESEAEQRRFLRETVLCVTHGKLDICDEEDIAPYVIESASLGRVDSLSSVPAARHRALEFCRNSGLIEELAASFEVGVGEAITNAVKHSSQGEVYAGRGDAEVWVAVADNGPGMTSMLLPRVAMTRGFSTAASLGMGYTVMLDSADRLLLHTDSNGTRLALVKSLVPVSPEPALENLRDAW